VPQFTGEKLSYANPAPCGYPMAVVLSFQKGEGPLPVLGVTVTQKKAGQLDGVRGQLCEGGGSGGRGSVALQNGVQYQCNFRKMGDITHVVFDDGQYRLGCPGGEEGAVPFGGFSAGDVVDAGAAEDAGFYVAEGTGADPGGVEAADGVEDVPVGFFGKGEAVHDAAAAQDGEVETAAVVGDVEGAGNGGEYLKEAVEKIAF